MAQQILDEADVGTGLEQVGGIGVAQHVGGNEPADSGPCGSLLHCRLQATLPVGFARPLALK